MNSPLRNASEIGASETAQSALSSQTSPRNLPSISDTLSQLKDNVKARQNLMQAYSITCESLLNPKITGWATLPPQLLQKIFAHVDHHQLIAYCTLVCKYWRRAIMTNRFVTSLRVSHNEAPMSFIYNFLREFKCLRTLALDNVFDVEAILLQAHKVCKNLKHISLTNYAYVPHTVLSYITRSFPLLEGLNLESSNVDCSNLSSAVAVFANLRSVNLFNVKSIGMSTQAILEIVLNCRQLEELNIGLCPPLVNLQDEDVLVIVTNLAGKLRSLALDARKLTMRSLERLGSCRLLTKVYIKYAVNLTGDFLADLWSCLHAVEELGFTHNCIVSGRDVSELFLRGAHVFAGLRLLDFTYCVKIDDAGVRAVAATCSRLRKVVLKSCRSITCVTPLFKSCAELRHIDVSYCLELQTNFVVPRQLEVLIIDERKKMVYYIERYKSMKYLKIYLSTSEFSEHLELL